jgi:ribonuclease D
MLVVCQNDLKEVCRRLREAGSVAMDTEFVRERSYYGKLGVVQVAADGVEAVIDPLEVGSLDPLLELLFDPAIEIIVHAGRGDFEIFFEMTGRVPNNIFDSQIAAAFIGFGSQISYANLVRRVAGVSLAKGQQLTDWTRRPLSSKQIEYALDDVRYLMQIREELGSQLHRLGRRQWVREECEQLEDPEFYRRPAPLDIYRTMNTSGLSRKRLAVLRDLAAWREHTAIRQDRPRNSIAKDPSLIELARQSPLTLEELRGLRFVGRNQSRERAEEILDVIRRAQESPLPELPAARTREDLPPQAEGLRRLLEAWIQARALEAEIAPGLLANRAQLDAVVAAHFRGEEARAPVMQGWRRDLVGADLLKILAGEMRLRVDPKDGFLRMDAD